jgi:[acyl-carrier-protein] S-malonyltransferase
MKAYIFPGQGAQFCGMGKELFESSKEAKKLFIQANKILGFDITKIMFGEDLEELKKTNVTQPAIFIHSVILNRTLNIKPDIVAGHSLGEFSALVSANSLSFEDGLSLVSKRANAMQNACNINPGSMAVIIGLEDDVVEKICQETKGIVVAANYNCPGQLVISGEKKSVEKACETFKNAGARRVFILPVGGAFHSPLMNPAKEILASAIVKTNFNTPSCPIYQNFSSKGEIDPNIIRFNLVEQLTSPVNWTNSVKKMIKDGASEFIEVGPGNVLQGLIRKIDRLIKTKSV